MGLGRRQRRNLRRHSEAGCLPHQRLVEDDCGGRGGEPLLGDRLGDLIGKPGAEGLGQRRECFSADEVLVAVDNLTAAYVDLREEGERFIDTYRRLGMEPFKERAYAVH